MLAKASAKDYRSVNEQIQKLVEDYLVEKGFMKDEDRKRPVIKRTD